MEDLISVIVPIYNVEEYLDECIESICNQTYDNLEIIMIDDGSTDRSGNIADKWAKLDKRCNIYHKKNEGISVARNCGIEKAKGKFLIFVDSDDLIEKNMIERLHQEIKKENVDIVCCGIKSRKNSKNEECYFELEDRIFTFEEYLSEMYFHKTMQDETNIVIPFTVAWNKIYRATLFNNIRYPQGKIHEDSYIIHHLVYEAKKIKWINEPLYIYRERGGSIMQDKYSPKRMDDFYALIDRVEFIQDKIDNCSLKNKIVAECLGVGRRHWCKIKRDTLWEEEKEKLKEIRKYYDKYVNNDTFTYQKKIVWFIFLNVPGIYYQIWYLTKGKS